MNTNTAVPTLKPKYKSHLYHTAMQWADKRAGWLHSEGKPGIRVASPPEFHGEAGVWTPEDLFLASVEACTMLTFVAFTQKLNLVVISYRSQAEGLLEFVDDAYRFTKVVLRPTVVVAEPSAIPQAEQALQEAHRSCLIAKSMRAEVVIEPIINSCT